MVLRLEHLTAGPLGRDTLGSGYRSCTSIAGVLLACLALIKFSILSQQLIWTWNGNLALTHAYQYL